MCPWLTNRSWTAICLVVGLVSGCGRGENLPSLHRVSGKVVIDENPADRAVITFYVLKGDGYTAQSFAETGPDGTFRVFTRNKDDGAPAGGYAVTVVLPDSSQTDGEAGPDRLEGRYADPRTSKLKVTVQERENQLPTFELTGP